MSVAYTPDMEQCMVLSLTPPLQGGGAAASGLGVEVELISPVRSRRNSVCDNVEEIAAKADRAEDLYRFTNEVVHT